MLRVAWQSAKFLGVASLASLAFLDNIGSVARVHGSSMMPTLHGDLRTRRDYVWLNTFSTRHFDVQRGDVVVFTSPSDPRRILIKRVVALEGDVVHSSTYKQNYVLIRRGCMWIEGDNKEMSMDSHSFGQVSRGLIIGKASYVIWPPDRWGKLKDVPESVVGPATTQRSFHDLRQPVGMAGVDGAQCPGSLSSLDYKADLPDVIRSET